MRLFDGFPFKSPEQTKREEQDFERRIFPLGPEQKTAAAAVLAQLIPPRRGISERDHMYAFASAKDEYTRSAEDGRALARAEAQLKQLTWLRGGERALILSLLALDAEVKDLQDYPDAARVRANTNSCSQPVIS